MMRADTIEGLRAAAGSAGDQDMVLICDLALALRADRMRTEAIREALEAMDGGGLRSERRRLYTMADDYGWGESSPLHQVIQEVLQAAQDAGESE